MWRQSDLSHVSTHVYNYSSCVPPIDTCLDGICDEFESLDPSLCPQDCYNNDKGEKVHIFYCEFYYFTLLYSCCISLFNGHLFLNDIISYKQQSLIKDKTFKTRRALEIGAAGYFKLDGFLSWQ